jgi:nicotinamide-nucleotide amidase
VSVASSPLRAAIVTVGDELLLGETVDSNAAWLGRELSSLGIPVVERLTVGDVDDDIRRAVRRAMERADLVLVTGGLGPTEDDRTRPAVADLLGAPLRVDPDLLAALEARFRSRGFTRLPPLNRSQAEVPEGASILANPRGTAPGLALLTDGGVLVVLLPGVPAEVRDIARGDLRSVLARTFSDRLRPLHHRLIHTTGIAESELAGRLEDALPGDMGPVSLAFLPDPRGVDLRLTARGVDEAQAREWLDRVEAALSPVVVPFRFEAETGDLVEAVSRALEDADLVMAAAESCTGGLVAKRMTDRPGSSRVFRGGIVAYANQIKIDVLGVDAATLESEGAVSEPVARQMALGACRVLDAPVGVGITGIAGPEGGSDEKPVGLVWYAVSVRGRVEARSQVFGPDREGIRERSAQAVLADLLRRLEAAG